MSVENMRATAATEDFEYSSQVDLQQALLLNFSRDNLRRVLGPE